MKTVPVHEAEARLSELLAAVELGEKSPSPDMAGPLPGSSRWQTPPPSPSPSASGSPAPLRACGAAPGGQFLVSLDKGAGWQFA
jgi:hypothetical protein